MGPIIKMQTGKEKPRRRRRKRELVGLTTMLGTGKEISHARNCNMNHRGVSNIPGIENCPKLHAKKGEENISTPPHQGIKIYDA